MKRSILSVSLLAVALLGGGCSAFTPATTAQVKAALLDPNNDAKAAKTLIAATANRILAKNPTYSDDVLALANALTAAAQSNGSLLTAGDVTKALANPKTKIDAATQAEIVADFTLAQGLFLDDFPVTLPTFKPIYQLWLQSVANGLYIATGNPTVAVPVIPPATAPGS